MASWSVTVGRLASLNITCNFELPISQGNSLPSFNFLFKANHSFFKRCPLFSERVQTGRGEPLDRPLPSLCPCLDSECECACVLGGGREK